MTSIEGREQAQGRGQNNRIMHWLKVGGEELPGRITSCSEARAVLWAAARGQGPVLHGQRPGSGRSMAQELEKA